jgi:Immunity protein 27
MINLRPDETVLVGNWIEVDGAVDGDETCKRIEQLVQSHLEQVATADGGWTRLFIDRNDGRYWELTYPHGEWHGGGPPTLTWIPAPFSRSKYDLR